MGQLRARYLAIVLSLAAYAGTAMAQSAGGMAATSTDVNYAPVAFPQLVQLIDANSITITLSAPDANGDTLTYSLVSGPGLGTVGTLDPNTGTIVYTPPANFLTTDSFTFSVSDGVLASGPAAVTILSPPATATVSPSSLNFGNQGLANTSAGKNIKVKNSGTILLTVSQLALIGTNPADYAFTSAPLPITLAKNKTTTIQVSFTPGALGASAAGLVITSNASASPQVVSLTGVGVAQVTLSPTSLKFAKQSVGTSSAPKSVTLTNNNSNPLTISSIVPSGDFSFNTTCGASVAAKAKCVIAVTFTPTAKGTRTGSLTINDDASNTPQVVALTGVGK